MTRTPLIYPTLLCALTLALFTVPAVGERATDQGVSGYLVQATDSLTASRAVAAEGGEVTHELAVIRAVGARLSEMQAAAVADHPGILRVLRNRGVRTASSACVIDGSGTRAIEDRKLSWEITNTGSEPVSLERIDLLWPTVNGSLKKIKLDGDEIFKLESTPPALSIDSAWQGELDRRQIAPDQTRVLLLEFTEDAFTNEADYGISLAFDRGCTVAFSPSPQSCVPAEAGFREIKDNRLTWQIANLGSRPLRIVGVEIEWPEVNGALEKARVLGAELDGGYGRTSPAAFALDWRDNDFELEPGATEDLELEFFEIADRNEASYQIHLQFAEGCSLELRSSPTSCLVADGGHRELKDRVLKWRIANLGTRDLRLSAVSANWPEGNGWLKKAKFRGAEVSSTLRPPPVATLVADWSDNSFELSIGATEELKLEFTGEVDLDEEFYGIVVEFAEGCELRFDADAPPPLPQMGDKTARDTFVPKLSGSKPLHDEGLTGRGVTVAIVDTGLWSRAGGSRFLLKDVDGNERVHAFYDALEDRMLKPAKGIDPNGHGSHLASIIGSSRKTWGTHGYDGLYNGVAPNAGLVVVRAFDDDGEGTYLDVIRGIDFVVRNKDLYDIRVMNLSFSATPLSHYWDDPLNQAVMAAWQAGIVVVASAGNQGPEPMTIGVPGNLPYVITVGALSDGLTQDVRTDDYLTSFSSVGPTFEGFVKPEVVAPGGHVLGIMDKQSKISKEHKEYSDGDAYFYMSGTSQATAVVSGVVALLLEARPELDPDTVKCRLMATARPAVDDQGKLGYSIFQQGAGLVSAQAAVASDAAACANNGLDVDLDLAGLAHYGGRANMDQDGNYYIMGLDGFIWSDAFIWNDAFIWSDAFVWNDGFIWSDAFVWNDGYLWSDVLDLEATGFVWSDSLSESMSINRWVPQE